MTAAPEDEAPGARARFGDVLAARVLSAPGDVVAFTSPVTTQNAHAAAVALAHESAALLPQAMRLSAAGDLAALEQMQRDRLAAATALVGNAVYGAWSTALPAQAPASPVRLRVTPNPIRDDATMAFLAPQAGTARLELYDLAGRRTVALDLGRFEAGPHRVALDRRALSAAAPGVYFGRFEMAGHVSATTIVIAAH
jgi:hypothetical protein